MLNLNKKQVCKMVVRFPALFAYSIETSLEPMVLWLNSYLGLNQKQVKGYQLSTCNPANFDGSLSRKG